MRRRARTLAALLFAASPSLLAQPSAAGARLGAQVANGLRPAVRVQGERDTSFAVTERMAHYHVPAVSIAVIDDFRIVWARGFGTTEFGGRDRVDTTTLFLAGSISKPVFASAALALVEQGRLALDEDVNARLASWRVPPSDWTAKEKVTLRRILSHTAGLTTWGFPGYDLDAPLPTVPQILDGVKPANTDAVRSFALPGKAWMYSGGGYTVAQLLATDVTGESFPALMQRLVLGPAGMKASSYEQAMAPARVRLTAAGHEQPDQVVHGRYHVYPEMAAAGLWTTPSDLARWAIMVARASRGTMGLPLSPAMARAMLTPQVQLPPAFASPLSPSWGLGVALAGSGDALVFSHGGRDEGFVATLLMQPSTGRGLVVMTNGVSGALLNEITYAFEEAVGLDVMPRAVKVRATRRNPAEEATLAGAYRLKVGNDSVTYAVRQHGARLFVVRTPTDSSELLPQGPDLFFTRESANDIRFERLNGRVSGFASEAGARRTVFVRVPE
ncbi:MAG: beta-lactamase family protein [Gemmatimonadetes bacterium]|nr:beta-lactamase family protein [Gemmatimonadota bacterium]